MDQDLEQIVAKLDTILALLEQPAVPLTDQLRDMVMVAKYFRRNFQLVRESMACLPSFPKAIRLRSKGRAHPLYRAAKYSLGPCRRGGSSAARVVLWERV